MIVLHTAWFFVTTVTCALLVISGFVDVVQQNLRQTKSRVACQGSAKLGRGLLRVRSDLNAVHVGRAWPTTGRGH